MKKSHKWRKRLSFLLPGVAGAVLLLLLPHFPAVTETVFSRGICRGLSVLVGVPVSLLPFSLTEIAVIIAVPAIILLLILFIRRVIRAKGERGRVWARGGRAVGWALSCVLLMYMLAHGANFYRRPVSDLLSIPITQYTPERLEEICADLADRASAEREGLKENANGVMILSQSKPKTLFEAADGYRALEKRYPVLWGVIQRPKPVMLSHLWSYTGIVGMYNPLFMEANVNIDQPDSDIPFTAAHELAHTRGFAREDEANFFAFLTCINNPSADARYSGYLNTYLYCENALRQADPSLADATAQHLSDAVKRDMQWQGQYWQKFAGPVQKASNSVNDGFISSQNVGGNGSPAGQGVMSYDAVVSLVVGYYMIN